MNKNLICRILGALASALIIVAVFVPFVSVTGYSTSLWETFEVSNSLYLPIMIIVFGIIGVIFFSLNKKTEFAYMSTGAITFFLVVYTIDVMNQGVFNTLSVGYYFLVIGTVLTGIMAFLTNLKSNKKQIETPINTPVESNKLGQIDNLYNTQNIDNASLVQPVPNIEPIPVIQPINSVVQEQPIQPQVIENNVNPVPVLEQPVMQQPIQIPENPVLGEYSQPVNPVIQEFTSGPIEQPIEKQPDVVLQQSEQISNNSAIQDLSQPINPVLQEFSQPINPVIQEFTSSPIEQTIVKQPELAENPKPQIQENPSLQDFMNPVPNPVTQTTDIFGQPINK